MSKKIKILLYLLLFIFVSCLKEPIETITIEGIVQDEILKEPIGNIYMSFDAIKSSTGMGIITNGKRETIGNTTTDKNGHYRIKLKVFKGAERLEFYINPLNMRKDYSDNQEDVDLSEIKNNSNVANFILSPTSHIKISFKNANPVSDTDFFYFNNFVFSGKGVTEGTVQEENCGSVQHNGTRTWTGKDVCGAFTIGTLGDRYTHISWLVKKNGITKQYRDSVYVKRNSLGQYLINY